MKNHCFFNDPEVIRGTEGGDAIEKQFYWNLRKALFYELTKLRPALEKPFVWKSFKTCLIVLTELYQLYIYWYSSLDCID